MQVSSIGKKNNMSGCDEVSKQQQYQYIVQFDVVTNTIAAEFAQHLVEYSCKKERKKKKNGKKERNKRNKKKYLLAAIGQ